MINIDAFRSVAVRAWTHSTTAKPKPRRRRREAPLVSHVLVFDTETTIDATQALLYGAFRYCRVDATTVTTVAEGLIYADDLPQRDPEGYQRLQRYATSHKADVDLTYLAVEPLWELQLVSRSEFVDRWLWHVAYPHNNRRDPATVVAFNAPFDLSRIAVDVAEARDDLYGGFSFTLWHDKDGHAASWRPRLAIKALDSKRAIKKFRKRERGAHDSAGHLLDLRTLVFALTGASHSLDSACRAFDVQGKASTPEFGIINDEAIDYCRHDVAATTRLYEAATAEYATHPIDLQPTVAYSPASIAKAYLRAMNIQPRLAVQPDFPVDILGYAMSAFYGGRAEVHLRHVPAPVAVVDFTSMYPTVDILMGIWRLVTAERVDTVDATAEVTALLATITADDCFNPQRWPEFVVIVEIVPDGDIVPVRADYRDEDWSIGVNPLHSDQPLWYTLPDLIASKLLSGRTPTVRRALRFVPSGGPQSGLQAVDLQGRLPVDPHQHDFFQRVVESRQETRRSVPGHAYDSCLCEPCRLARFLKVLANSGSYGIYAEMIRHEHPDTVTVHGPTGQPFTVKVAAPEEPGEYCFPPIAACITGAARLMLALLELSITDAGGTWIFCDTDSMAIVATQHGGDLIACPGGTHVTPDGDPAILSLSLDQVESIRHRFNALNPYNRDIVSEVLKLEMTGQCYAISAKRYVVYERDRAGDINVIKRSEHGLGRYLDPLSPKTDRRDSRGNRVWISDTWTWILAAHDDPDAPLPSWADQPALSRVTVSSPLLWRPFTRRNDSQPWADQVKPFNFLLVATIDPFGYPTGIDPLRFRLIAPYTDNPDTWTDLGWRNLYDPSGPSYRITTDQLAPPSDDVAVATSYTQVLREYRVHPEYKFNGPDQQPCLRSTRGMLQRRPVHIAGRPRHIGKEANNIDNVQAGLHASQGEILTEYDDPHEDTIHQLVMPVLSAHPGQALARLVGCDRRTINRIRNGQTPRPELRASLTAIAVTQAASQLVAHLPETTRAAATTRLRHDPIATLTALRLTATMRPQNDVADRH